MRTIPSLDGLRAVAVLMVVAAHLSLMDRMRLLLLHVHAGAMASVFQIDIGDLGVSIFFVISGFLITTLLLKEIDGVEGISLKRFYQRRFFRIVPPYTVYLLCIAGLKILHRSPIPISALVTAFTYTSNYYPYALTHPESIGRLVGHTWSLSLEEQFYLCWPLLLVWLGRRRAANVGICLLVLAPISRVVTLHLEPGLSFDGQIVRMFHTRIDTIMVGSMLALWLSRPRGARVLARAAKSSWSGVAATLLLGADLIANAKSLLFDLWIGLSLEGLLLAYLVYFSVSNAETVWGRVLNSRAARHIGVISYSLYLWQQVFTGSWTMLHRYTLLLLPAVLLCAELSYWTVERWSYRVRDWLMGSGAPLPDAGPVHSGEVAV